jgi:hypothetical protein
MRTLHACAVACCVILLLGGCKKPAPPGEAKADPNVYRLIDEGIELTMPSSDWKPQFMSGQTLTGTKIPFENQEMPANFAVDVDIPDKPIPALLEDMRAEFEAERHPILQAWNDGDRSGVIRALVSTPDGDAGLNFTLRRLDAERVAIFIAYAPIGVEASMSADVAEIAASVRPITIVR